MNLQSEREELVEMFGIHFEAVYHLSPLGSRILGLLIIDGCKEGLTFDQIVEKTKSSKSSVSTNLNLLLKMEKIKYFTITGDRRKHFKASPFSERISNYIKIIDFEKKIIDKMLTYRQKTISCSEETLNLEQGTVYKEHIQKVEDLLKKSISEFIAIENKQ